VPNEIISLSIAMNVHLNPFVIWNSYAFQTELAALLGRIKTTSPLFVKSNISQVFILSSGVFQPTTTLSKCQYVFTMFIYYSYLAAR